MAWRQEVAPMITSVIMFPISYPKSPEASLHLLQLPPRSHILLFVPAVMIEKRVKGSKEPLPVFLWSPPWTLSVFGGRLLLILAHNQFILITSGSTGSGALIDWQVFAYTVRNQMSRTALAVTCVGCWQNKLMRVIYHAACALLSWGSRAHYC